MANQWLFKSETYDNCNCAVNCGCQFNLPSTHGYCQSAFVGNTTLADPKICVVTGRIASAAMPPCTAMQSCDLGYLMSSFWCRGSSAYLALLTRGVCF